MLPVSSHFDDSGNAQMVDVSTKTVSARTAIASSDIMMLRATAEMIRSGQAKKGDVLGVARLAAIQATKLTPLLIPLCHAIAIESVTVQFEWLTTPEQDGQDPNGQDPIARDPIAQDEDGQDQEIETLRCLVRVGTVAKTGVEMEAMSAACVAGLTVYDMVKSVDRRVTIGPVQLVHKSGGKSGDFQRQP